MKHLVCKGKWLLIVGVLIAISFPINAQAVTISKTQSESTASIIELLNESLHGQVEENEAALAEAFLDTLSQEEREAVKYDLTEENATHWTNLPANYENRNGTAIGDLPEESVRAALQLMKASLSEEGYKTLTEIMKADAFLLTDTGDEEYGPGLYFIAILGTPSDKEPWMIQFSGHHLAENLVFNGEEKSATPQFTGTEPDSFTWWDNITYEPLKTRRSSIYSIIDELDKDQLKASEISETFDDVVVGAGEDGNFPDNQGILYTDLTSSQQDLVQTAIRAWVDDAQTDKADALLDAYLADEALKETYIGWSGSPDYHEEGSYVRIDGPRAWIEFSSREAVTHPDNLHFHTIWRDKLADYGGLFAG
ncbi:hypothetical protein HNR44_003127 [Geomicrobium halophilum]|uniref:DUF3500 domain-containing protein n=1 Tax=Geomicrobium halophilum TaxID=549000 RepID=A0A841Q0F2_9BACL|nr:DUF3500 domain-containing protein [Geomicrobium halophilum]MBB6451133.1 hypothetical protein [Geomicrobium halophilum]